MVGVDKYVRMIHGVTLNNVTKRSLPQYLYYGFCLVTGAAPGMFPGGGGGGGGGGLGHCASIVSLIMAERILLNSYHQFLLDTCVDTYII